MEDIRKDIANKPIEGVCRCMWDDLPWDLVLHRKVPHCLRMPHVETNLQNKSPARWTRECVEMDCDARCTCPIDSSALMDVEPTSGVITMRAHN
jgi:hypothetical protein